MVILCLAQQLGSSNSPEMLLKVVGVLLDDTVSSYPRLKSERITCSKGLMLSHLRT